MYRRSETGRFVADIPVLAKDATEVAATEEDTAGTAPAAQAILFAVVRAVAGNAGTASDAAGAAPVVEPVGTATVRAEAAFGEQHDGLFGTSAQFAGLGKGHVGRREVHAGNIAGFAARERGWLRRAVQP